MRCTAYLHPRMLYAASGAASCGQAVQRVAQRQFRRHDARKVQVRLQRFAALAEIALALDLVSPAERMDDDITSI